MVEAGESANEVTFHYSDSDPTPRGDPTPTPHRELTTAPSSTEETSSGRVTESVHATSPPSENSSVFFADGDVDGTG